MRGLAILPAAVLMVLIAPRSAKLVEAKGARFTLLIGYVFCLLGFVTMLLLWNEGIAVLEGRARLRLHRSRRRVRRHSGVALADRIGPGEQGRDGIGHRRPAARPRWRDHAVDPRRAADGGLREPPSRPPSHRRPNGEQVSDSVEAQLTKSFSSADGDRTAVPAVHEPDHRRPRSVLPRRYQDWAYTAGHRRDHPGGRPRLLHVPEEGR